MRVRIATGAAVAVALAVPAGGLTASNPAYVAKLTTGQETTGCADAGDKARGSAVFKLSSSRRTMSFTVNTKGLSGRAVAAHIHEGKRGEAGDVLVDLAEAAGDTAPLSGRLKGRFGDAALAEASDIDTVRELATAMRRKEVYVNVHTQACPAGEIRGQLRKQKR